MGLTGRAVRETAAAPLRADSLSPLGAPLGSGADRWLGCGPATKCWKAADACSHGEASGYWPPALVHVQPAPRGIGLVGQHLRMIEELEATVTAFDARIEAVLAPFRDAAERLMSLPGISDVAAQVILAEIGTDMSSFPTAGHLLSWAGLTPRLDESAGKRRSTRLTKGAPWLKPVLVQCALAAARAKNTYLQAQFLRLKARRGPKKAAIAVAPSILTAVYHGATVPSFATSDRPLCSL